MNDHKPRLTKRVSQAAKQAFAAYVKNPHQRLYLYHSVADQFGKWGELFVSDGRPRFTEMSHSMPIPRDQSLENIAAWIADKCRYLPIIGS